MLNAYRGQFSKCENDPKCLHLAINMGLHYFKLNYNICIKKEHHILNVINSSKVLGYTT